MKIWVDADACPGVIKEILYRAAERAQVPTTFIANASDVDVARVQRIALDEGAARLDVVAHERGEYLVGGDGIVDLHLEQAPRFVGSIVVSQSCSGFISPSPL
jgi:hypothetical protein